MNFALSSVIGGDRARRPGDCRFAPRGRPVSQGPAEDAGDHNISETKPNNVALKTYFFLDNNAGLALFVSKR